MVPSGNVYESEIIEIMSAVLAAVWDTLPEISKRPGTKRILTERIMEAAARGAVDQSELRAAALRGNIIA